MRKSIARLLAGISLLSLSSMASAVVAINDVTRTIDSGPDIGSLMSRPVSVTFTFFDLSPAAGGGTLSVSAFGDINDIGENVDVYAEGTFLGTLFNDQAYDEPALALTDSLVIPGATFATLLADGTLDVTLQVDETNGASAVRFDSLSLTYAAAVPEPSEALMLFAGLGLVTALAARRKARAAAGS